MVRDRKQLVWALAACAAVVVQAAPKTACHACDQPCCSGQAIGHAPQTGDSAFDEPIAGCPQCRTADGPRLATTTEHPCRCQLDARHEKPTALSRGGLTAVADGAPAAGMAVVPPVVPQDLRVSREYVATSLTVPIRPPRILYGIWRN